MQCIISLPVISLGVGCHSFSQSGIKGSLLIASRKKIFFLITRDISMRRRLPLFFLLWVGLLEEVVFGLVVAILFILFPKWRAKRITAKLSQSYDILELLRQPTVDQYTSIILVLRDDSLLFRCLIGYCVACMPRFRNRHHILYFYILHRHEQKQAFNKLMGKNCINQIRSLVIRAILIYLCKAEFFPIRVNYTEVNN